MDSRTRVTAISSVAVCALGVCVASVCQSTDQQRPFSFSSSAEQEHAKAQEDAAKQAQTIQALVSAPCRQQLKEQKILLLIGEETSNRWMTTQGTFGQFVRIIETRLKGLGLKPYSEQEIKASIAQAEIDAYFNNDPDAALAASKRMGARYILRGSISTRSGINPVVRVNEVAVTIELTLSAVDGRVLSDVNAHADSYSGSDTLGTALTLMREQADPLVAQLYNDYCREGAAQQAK
jgi:uncharacterized HAD superfamily protein